MKPQQNLNGLGFAQTPSQACAIEGCDPDFTLMSSVVIPGAAQLLTATPTPYASLTAAFPGGDTTDRGLWFFQKGLSEQLQTGKQYLQGGNLTSADVPIGGQILMESMQVHMVGLQIASAYGNTPVAAHDVQIIADSGLFEMWLSAIAGTSPDSPTFSDYPDISVPVVSMPSNVGVYGNTTVSGTTIASLGVPGLVFAAELKNKPILQKNQILGARITFPAQSVANGIPGVGPSGAVAPSLTTVGGVLVRLFLFGKAVYQNRSF